MRRAPVPTNIHKEDPSAPGGMSFPEPPTGAARWAAPRSVRQRRRRRQYALMTCVLVLFLVAAFLLTRHDRKQLAEPVQRNSRSGAQSAPATTGVTDAEGRPSDTPSAAPLPPHPSTSPPQDGKYRSTPPKPSADAEDKTAAVLDGSLSVQQARDGVVPLALVAVSRTPRTGVATMHAVAVVDRASLTNATPAPSPRADASATPLTLPSHISFTRQLAAAGVSAETRQALLPALTIRLLRQRLTRSLWATDATLQSLVHDKAALHCTTFPASLLCDHAMTHHAHLPIISLDPQEGMTTNDDTALYFPSEVLVEEYGDGDSGRRQRVDPGSTVPAWFADGGEGEDEEDEGEGRAAWETARPTRIFSPVAGGSMNESTDTAHLLPVVRVHPVSSLPVSLVSDLVGVESSGAVVQWLLHHTPPPLDSAASRTSAATVPLPHSGPSVFAQMHRVHKKSVAPWLTGRPGSGDSDNDRHNDTRGLVERDTSIPTFVLAGRFWLPRVHRLRGFAPRRTAPTAGAAEQPQEVHFSFSADIPLNGHRELGLTMGAAPDTARAGGGSAASAGVVPLILADLQTPSSADGPSSPPSLLTVGILWLNSAPLLLQTATSPSTKMTQLTLHSTGGATTVFLLPGPTPADVLRQYYTLTGFPTLPPRHALGFQHGYIDTREATQESLTTRNALLAREEVPVDGLLCTTEAVHQHRVPFSFAPSRFPNVMRMQVNLWRTGRRHLSVRNEPTIPIRQHLGLYQEARSRGFFVSEDPDDDKWLPVLTQEGELAHVIDFSNRRARYWYGGTHKYKRFLDSTNYTHFFLQSAAPVLSDGGRRSAVGATLPMHAGHHGGVFHRDLHNAYNFLYALSSAHGSLRRSRYFRRAVTWTANYFVGLQRVGLVAYRGAAGALVDVPAVTTTATPDNTSRAPTSQPTLAPILPWLHGEDERADTPSRLATPASIAQSAWSGYREGLDHVLSLAVLGIPFSLANVADASLYIHELMVLAKAAKTDPEAQSATDDGDWATALLQLEELSLRWYQLSVVMPLVHSEGLLDSASSGCPWSADAVMTTGSHTVPPRSPLFFLPHILEVPELQAALTDALGGADGVLDEVRARWQGQEQLSRDAIRLRYALLPYLYTAAWRTSVLGEPLWFLSSRAAVPAETPCVAVGRALLVCPPTRASVAVQRDVDVPHAQFVTLPSSPTAPASTRPSSAAVSWYDVWTGEAYAAGDVLPLPTFTTRTVNELDKHSLLNTWLVDPEVAHQTKGVERVADGRHSSAPLFQAAGTVVVTQNVYRAAPATKDLHSTAAVVMNAETPTNFTVTVALPSLRAAKTELQAQPWHSCTGGRGVDGDADSSASLASAARPRAPSLHAEEVRQLQVATGELVWDDGQSNFQVSPPPPSSTTKHHGGDTTDWSSEATFCHVQISCHLTETRFTDATTGDDKTPAPLSAFSLVLSGHQVGYGCERALRTWASRHDDLAAGFVEYLKANAAEAEGAAWSQAMNTRRQEDLSGSRGPTRAHTRVDENRTRASLTDFTPTSEAELRSHDSMRRYWDGLTLASMHLVTRVRLLFADDDDWRVVQLPSALQTLSRRRANTTENGDMDNGSSEGEGDEGDVDMASSSGVASDRAERTAQTPSHGVHSLFAAQREALKAFTPRAADPTVARYVIAQRARSEHDTTPSSTVVLLNLAQRGVGAIDVDARTSAQATHFTEASRSVWLAETDALSTRLPMFGAVSHPQQAHDGAVHITPDARWRITSFFE